MFQKIKNYCLRVIDRLTWYEAYSDADDELNDHGYKLHIND